MPGYKKCVDNLAPSHLSRTSDRAGAEADSTEDLKRHKYATLAFWSQGSGTVGALRVFKILLGRLVGVTRDLRPGSYLGQRIRNCTMSPKLL